MGPGASSGSASLQAGTDREADKLLDGLQVIQPF